MIRKVDNLNKNKNNNNNYKNLLSSSGKKEQ